MTQAATYISAEQSRASNSNNDYAANFGVLLPLFLTWRLFVDVIEKNKKPTTVWTRMFLRDQLSVLVLSDRQGNWDPRDKDSQKIFCSENRLATLF